MLPDVLKRVIIDSIKEPKTRTGFLTASLLWGVLWVSSIYWENTNLFSNPEIVHTCNKEIEELNTLIDNKLTYVILPRHDKLVSNSPKGHEQKVKALERIMKYLVIIRYSQLIREKKACTNGDLLTSDLVELKRKIISDVSRWETND